MARATKPLKAPFPAIGGKSKTAALVWERLGEPDNYIEPFFFSGATLLGRPHPPRVETANDLDCMVANFWRATQRDPEAVVEHVDWPVNETDMHAIHRWLVSGEGAEEFRRRVREDPDYYDAKRAGRWCWGACCWIGGGWCTPHGETADGGRKKCRPSVCHTGKALNGQVPPGRRPQISGDNPGSYGKGVHALGGGNRPQLADAYARGRGVHGNDAAEVCADRRAWLLDWFGRLRDRMRTVRVCCGHWKRVCDSESVTTRLGLTGVFLDPPYPTHAPDGTESRSPGIYATDTTRTALDELRDEVLAWCKERGDDPRMRVAVCGLDTDGYAELEGLGWDVVAWKSSGYQNVSEAGRRNANRERIWFSPHCVKPGKGALPLFDALGRAEP
jgi:hypothetical protein